LTLDSLLSQIEQSLGKKKKAMLLVDEIQHLATSKKFSSLTHALRTMIDKRQGNVKAIFTGSSRHYMNNFFINQHLHFTCLAIVSIFPI